MAYTTINKSTDYFNTKLYTGNGSLPRAITGVGHQPDFVWIKNRDVGYHHQLYDSVRGTSAGVLYSTLTDAEDSTYQLSSFDSDGYTMGSNLGAVNGNGEDIVSWNWKANGAGSSNTDGSITSTVSANTTSGFSIVQYTGNSTSGATVGHGLGVVPKMIIVKTTARAGNWVTYHHTLGATKYLELNNNGAVGTSTAAWNDTAPTSSVFSLGSWSNTNDNGYGMIAYCFAEKKGYSKFGSYVANGNTDGTFIYTGFKPAWVMYRRSDGSVNWNINDNKRDTYNVAGTTLQANSSGAEFTYMSSGGYLDFLSNGFKCRGLSSAHNTADGNYIYMAFAEAPLVGTNNVPCTAR